LAQGTLFNRTRRLREEAFEIAHHNVVIEGQSYFVAQATNTDIPEILMVERAVYDGQTPWDRTAFANELRRKVDRLYLVIRHNDQLMALSGLHLTTGRRLPTLPTWPFFPNTKSRDWFVFN
jgi:ribosomal-protein-alanine N-acetyltransferase